jgi:hypothetical protein
MESTNRRSVMKSSDFPAVEWVFIFGENII